MAVEESADNGSIDIERLRAIQDDRLTETVRHAYANVPFYRDRLNDAGVHPDEGSGVDARAWVPFTTKAAFRLEYPDGLVAVDAGTRSRSAGGKAQRVYDHRE